MKYRVHRLEVTYKDMDEKLQEFINKLSGEVISVFPNVRPAFQFMGSTAKIDALVIVERTR